MRYLHVISSMDPLGGGPAEGVRQLCGAANRLGHEVEVASLDAPGATWAGDLPCPLHLLGPTRLGTYSYAPRLRRWLAARAGDFDAIVIDGLWQYHSYATWRAVRGTATPYFVFTHGMLDPWFRHQYPLKHLKKMLYWPWAEYRVLREASGVLFTCEEERLQSRRSFPFLYRAREMVVPLGTPGPPAADPGVQRETFLSAFPRLRNRSFLLFLGRIHPVKGCDLLIEAFTRIAPRHPDMDLVIAGPDPHALRGQLLAGIPGLDPERIVWTGMISGDTKWGAILAADALILPSHHENFGMVVAEALACGTPVLISNKVNIWREVAAGGGGLVEDDTAAGTMRLIDRWLALPDAARRAMARAAPETFRRHFHIDVSAQGLYQVLAADTRDAPRPQPSFAA